jgi:hypothetical protein
MTVWNYTKSEFLSVQDSSYENMTKVSESGTGQNSDSLIEDVYTRAGDGLITEIDTVTRTYSGEEIRIIVSEPSNAEDWRYEVGNLATWDEDKCWLVSLAKERGYTLEEIQKLEGEKVYVECSEEESSWTMYSEHPSELFDEKDISNSITVERTKTLDSRSEVTQEDNIEAECMKYEKIGDFFVCEIDKLNEIERDGACNIIECIVDTPYDRGKWEFKKPYGWNSDNTLVELAESRNYGKGNFTELVGDKVLVERKDNEWILETTPPDNLRDPNITVPESETSDEKISILEYIKFWNFQ